MKALGQLHEKKQYVQNDCLRGGVYHSKRLFSKLFLDIIWLEANDEAKDNVCQTEISYMCTGNGLIITSKHSCINKKDSEKKKKLKNSSTVCVARMALRVRELAGCSEGYRSNPDGHETLQDWWCNILIRQAAAESSLQKKKHTTTSTLRVYI